MRFVVPVFVMLLMSIGLKSIINESDTNLEIQSLEFIEEIESQPEDATSGNLFVRCTSNEIETYYNISRKVQ
ncbi:MAG: hypothetical protein HOB26_08430 [Flavobacteriales bacterium]|jgi:hypothetical protein|nr:hypothetical protein [Flavobacteriales bacterium]MBT6746565.1 hypothetical protein [Flavobacteriales bacterium]